MGEFRGGVLGPLKQGSLVFCEDYEEEFFMETRVDHATNNK